MLLPVVTSRQVSSRGLLPTEEPGSVAPHRQGEAQLARWGLPKRVGFQKVEGARSGENMTNIPEARQEYRLHLGYKYSAHSRVALEESRVKA